MVAKGAEQALSPQSLTDRITVTLREHIVGGKYAPGRQLPAGKDLSQAFGVSIQEFLQPHLHEAIALTRANSARRPETKVAAYQEHREIFQAIEAQDQRRARTAVRRVLDGSLRRLSDSGQLHAG